MARKVKKCGIIVDVNTKKPTHGLKCQDDATYAVHDLTGKVIGYNCEQHGLEFEQLLGYANAYVSNAVLGKN